VRAFYVGTDMMQMLLRDFRVYGGTIFLDPRCVVVKGGRVEEKAAIQDELFLSGLRSRMGSVIHLGDSSCDADQSSRLPVEESAELAAYREGNLKPPPAGRGPPQPGPANPASGGNAPRKRKAPSKDPLSLSDTTVEKSRFFIKPKPEITATQLMKAGVFSPLTRTTTVIEIESDEEKTQPSPVVSTQAKTLNTSLTRTETEYSFEGDDYMENPDFFRELERVETAVLSQQYAPSISAGPSQTRPSQNPISRSQAPYSDTIEVDEDKENESVPERRVRRKLTTRKVAAAPNQSVISIEDSD
jgi:hypothetical protein